MYFKYIYLYILNTYCCPGKKWAIYNYKNECIETINFKAPDNIIY